MLGRLPWIVLLPVLVFAAACKGGEEPTSASGTKVIPQANGPSEPNSVTYSALDPKESPGMVLSGKFESGTAKVEVLGVCKLTEDSVECWKSSGERDPELSAKVSKGLKPISLSSGITGEFTMHYGLKNRLVILNIESGASPYDSKIGSYKVGVDLPYGTPPVAIKDMSDAGNTVLKDSIRALMVAEAKDAKTTRVDFVYQEPIRENVELPMKQGEEAKIAGVTMKLVGWEAMPQAQWYVQIDTDTASLKGLNVAFKPLDAQGKPFEYSDKDGDPITQVQYDRMTPEERAFLHNAREPITTKMKGGFQVRLMIHPSKVSALAIYAIRTKQGRIEKIALDPK